MGSSTAFSTSTNLHPPPPSFRTSLCSGCRFHIRERRHVEKPQPRQPRVLVHLDEQQVGDTHDGGGALASGHVTTSTPWMQPPATSMTTNEPSPPSRSTVPLRPVVFPVPLHATERMSVSGSQR